MLNKSPIVLISVVHIPVTKQCLNGTKNGGVLLRPIRILVLRAKRERVEKPKEWTLHFLVRNPFFGFDIPVLKLKNPQQIFLISCQTPWYTEKFYFVGDRGYILGTFRVCGYRTGQGTKEVRKFETLFVFKIILMIFSDDRVRRRWIEKICNVVFWFDEFFFFYFFLGFKFLNFFCHFLEVLTLLIVFFR